MLSKAANAEIAKTLPDMVAGISYHKGGFNKEERPEVLQPAMFEAYKAYKAAIAEGFNDPRGVAGRLSDQDGHLGDSIVKAVESSPRGQMTTMVEKLGKAAGLEPDIVKDITSSAPLASGLVPFDLEGPAKLIYPVMTVVRNRLPRVKGKGSSHRAKMISSIAGSQVGANGAPFAFDISEFPGGQSFANWPVQLPPSSSESGSDLNVPYRFMGKTKNVSWLAQWQGQGYQDLVALANLILLHETMLSEEFMDMSGCNTTLAAPGTLTLTLRAALSGEAAITGPTSGTSHVYVVATALNHFGETVMSAVADGGVWSTGDVYDVVIPPVPGALQYNVYASYGTSASTRAQLFKVSASAVGGTKFTIQGPVQAQGGTGTNPPAADTSTGAATRYDGIFSILDGKAAGGTYPNGTVAGYLNQNCQQVASISLFNTALKALWNVTKGSPEEVWMEGSDLARLSDDIRTNAAQSYRISLVQSDMAHMIAGGAVSEFVNPVTRDLVRLLVIPGLLQGNAVFQQLRLPMPFSNVSNVWEKVLVHDFASIAWPVIDLTYRFSMLLDGALLNYAPIYCGRIGGMQTAGSATAGGWA